ncbi:uncharacterized protein LY79DRAFT_578641 [Colletotrichum navitas]|uniref:Uncharacterized protein n=1 Tax=Colletotrichum navitas TaxID=681940 RepID=A0AAD8V4V7_9PEZI|nr:uncharacterized protein LY79DRAFT_578641 [Colletotrichum navitas]KAK1594347.1 hypothetical protein LY79DRAFT_578641 [Colletotrichum navitas]
MSMHGTWAVEGAGDVSEIADLMAACIGFRQEYPGEMRSTSKLISVVRRVSLVHHVITSEVPASIQFCFGQQSLPGGYATRTTATQRILSRSALCANVNTTDKHQLDDDGDDDEDEGQRSASSRPQSPSPVWCFHLWGASSSQHISTARHHQRHDSGSLTEKKVKTLDDAEPSRTDSCPALKLSTPFEPVSQIAVSHLAGFPQQYDLT